jgi:uncharacterized protein
VRLEEDGADTVLHYEVKADVGGKLAQLGSRLIDSTAKKLAGEFFTRFGEIVAGPPPEEDAAERAEAAVPPSVTETPGAVMRGDAARTGGGRLWLWGLGGLVVVLAAAILLAR